MRTKSLAIPITDKPSFLRLAESFVQKNPFVLKNKDAGAKQNKVGRPRAITQAIVGKLEQAFSFDCTVEEACVYAGIHKDTYYNFLKEYPEFSDRVALLRHCGILVARMSVLAAVEHNSNLAFRYLERKRPQEFSLRATVTHKVEPDSHTVDADTAEQIDSAISLFVKRAAEVREDFVADESEL